MKTQKHAHIILWAILIIGALFGEIVITPPAPVSGQPTSDVHITATPWKPAPIGGSQDVLIQATPQ